MKTQFQRKLVAVLAAALLLTMLSLPAFAVEGATPNPAKTAQAQQAQQAQQAALKGGTPLSANANPQAKRTILLYDCGADLETDAGLATYNLMQILKSSFSSDDDIKFLVMTGGSHKWQIDSSNLVFPGGVNLPDDAVIEYDSDNLEYAQDPSDPRSQVSNIYNQIWEAKGIDAKDGNAGKLVLLDGDGITDDNAPVKSQDELMSDPATLKAFINYAATNYPADKYDLILWDHGGGPKLGFGVDEHRDDSGNSSAPEIMSFASIVDALSDNAVTDANGDGTLDGKFDFINFDACLMNSVELALAMADYTDYYIASAETEPGYGQYYGPRAERDGKQYKGWLDELGNPANDSKYNAAGGTYELGKVIVDDFYNFYEKETGDGHSQEGTLAVVDTQKMMDSEFVETLTALSRVLKGEAGNLEQTGVHFYDEMKSYYNSIEYGGYELFDLGNISALLSVVISEVSEDHIDEADNYYINSNDYHDISRTLNRMLVDETFMYAKGTSGIATKEQFCRTLDDELGHGKLGASGMSIYFPGKEMFTSVTSYFDELDPVINRLPDNDKRKKFLKDYEAAVAYYELIFYSGTIVNSLINDEDNALETMKKSDVDYDLVMDRIQDPVFGNWNELVVPCMNKIGLDEEGMANWFRVLIPQQTEDAVDGKEVKLEKLEQDETGACTVTINGARKRIVDSVDRSIYVELPALEAYISGLSVADQKAVTSAGQLSVGSVKGTITGQPAGDSIRDTIRWYNESGSEWSIDRFDEKWYAVNDASGEEHVASIYLSDEEGIYVPAIIETSAGGASAGGASESRQLMLEFSPEEGHKLTSVYYMNANAAPIQVEPKNLTRAITVMPALVVKRTFNPNIYVPISHAPFTISAGNADSISLDFMDISAIDDIGDTDGDGIAYDTMITITDLYGYKIHVSDRVQIKRARIKPAIYTGEELQPELVYQGQTLQPGVDYILEKERTWNQDTQTYGEPAFIEPGDYMVALYGKGPFTGRKYEAIFSIVRSEEAAQELIDQAQTNLQKAQAAFANLDPNDQAAMQKLFADLFAAQNALTEAQNELARTKDILTKEQMAQMEGQIAQLEQQIEGLGDQLAGVSAVDISNYAVTMPASAPYTGNAIEPAVKVSGLNESCYTVSYSDNKEIGTAKVTITATGDKYKGTITKTFEIVKAANPLKVKGKKAVVKYKKLKKKAQTLAATKVMTFANQINDAKTYALSSAKKGKKYFKVNKATGNITVKKGLKKGTYKVAVKVKAEGNSNYNASGNITVSFKVKVK